MSEPFGFRPVRGLAAAAVRANKYALASGSQQVFKGDLMVQDSGGKIARASSSASSTGPFCGVALENGPSTASASDEILICDDPDAIFEAVCTSAIARTGINLNYNAYVVDGSSTLKKSLSKIGSSITTSLGVKVIGYVNRADNTANSAGQEVLCIINNHSFRAGTAPV